MRSAECRTPKVRFKAPMRVRKLEVGATHEPPPPHNLHLNLNPNPNRRGVIKINTMSKIISRTRGFMAPMRVQKLEGEALHEPPPPSGSSRRKEVHPEPVEGLTSILDCRFSNAECRMSNVRV